MFGLRPRAPGDRYAHEQVALAGVARQHGRVGREQRHEQRGPAVARQLPEAVGEVGPERHVEPRTAVRLAGRARVVGRQRQGHGRAGQNVAPVPLVVGVPARVPALLLPEREVAVLHREVDQPGGRTGKAGGVAGGQFPEQQPERPAVGHDVVHGEDEHVPFRRQPQQYGPQQRPLRQVERFPGGGDRGGRSLRVRVGGGRQVHIGQSDRAGPDDLYRLAVHDAEHGPQRLVPVHHVVQRAGQRRPVEGPVELYPPRHDVRDTVRVELIQQPEPPLRERHRQFVGLAVHQSVLPIRSTQQTRSSDV